MKKIPIIAFLLLAAVIVTDVIGMPTLITRDGWENRFFQYGGKFEYIVGMDLQQLASDFRIDFKNKVDLLSRYDINKIRIWGITNFLDQEESNLYPYKYDAHLNKFDLFNWNEKYWLRLDSFLKYAQLKRIVVEISIFEISGPMVYFGERANRRYPFHKKYNLQNWGTPNPKGTFVPEFFDLNYQEKGISALYLQKALIDKFIQETEDNPNVYFEIMNEFPGKKKFAFDPEIHEWQKTMASYIASKTDKLVTVHAHGYGNNLTSAELEKSSLMYCEEPNIDGINFHLYNTNPNQLSNLMHGFQNKGKMLINNEGGDFFTIVSKLAYPKYELESDGHKLSGEIRASWGHATAGGYYLFYFGPVPAIGNRIWEQGAKAAQAQRRIMETLSFWNLKPVAGDGSEYDTIVASGPASDWQVLANEGVEYLVYFWGNKTTTPVEMKKPTGEYEYRFYDTRAWTLPLSSGVTTGNIPAPPLSGWDAESGVVLTLKKKSN